MTDHTEGLPEPEFVLTSKMGNYIGYMAKGFNHKKGDGLYTTDQMRAYGEACAKAAREDAASWEKQASDRVDDALRFAREADEWKAKAMEARVKAMEDAARVAEREHRDFMRYCEGMGMTTDGPNGITIAAAIRALSSKEAEQP
jgi:hypothetical protein